MKISLVLTKPSNGKTKKNTLTIFWQVLLTPNTNLTDEEMHSTRKVYQTDIPNRKVNSTFYVSKRLHGRLSACAHGNGDVEKNVYATLSNWIIFLILCFCICPPYYVTNSIEFNLIWHSAGSIVWSFSIFLLVIISPARIWTIVYFCRFIQSFLVFYFNNA